MRVSFLLLEVEHVLADSFAFRGKKKERKKEWRQYPDRKESGWIKCIEVMTTCGGQEIWGLDLYTAVKSRQTH